jgi:protein-S-isoprenylcysteine O-methyltransferase Ste14
VDLPVFLALRSLAVLVLIPGTVAVFLPFQILQAGGRIARPALTAASVPAACLVLFGFSILLLCVWDFFATGRGTLAPFDPPRRLVVGGLYRFTRNPMYNGVLAALVGEAWLFRSTALLAYAVAVFILFHVFVVAYEEPALASQFGESYRRYRHAVPRWGFSLRPFPASNPGHVRSKEDV